MSKNITITERDRVKVWNTFFKLARDEAVNLKKLQKPSRQTNVHSFRGGTLDDAATYSLTVVAWCYLALEARVNHLLEELKEKGKLSNEEALAARYLNTQQKWALLPKLAGKTKSATISFDRQPHQSIAQLCSLRNDLFHVNYDKLLEKLPKPGAALSLFNQFVEAMEDMNVILVRHRKRHANVLKIALH